MKSKLLKIVSIIIVFSFIGCSNKKEQNKVITKLDTPLGLENLTQYIPKDNPLTKEKISLGRDLFFDKRLSVDGTVSCSFCHSPLLGFSDGRYFASGVFGLKSKRNTTTLLNRIFAQENFWDGRAKSIEEVISEHIKDPNVFANNLDNIIKLLKEDKKYIKKFNNAFNSDITGDGLVKAIATFIRTLVTGNSPYDKFLAGDKNALSESAQSGLKLFMSDRLKCSVCHSGPNFSDEKYHNNGTKINKENPDLGRYLITKNDEGMGKFRTPTLRDIGRTSPYMHNGSIKGLHALVDFYNKGGEKNIYKSPLIKPLNLTDSEKNDLFNFLRSLTGTNVYFFGYR
ncbi:MAG: cytochrome-c peroxidase [Ignavibacteriales bacterium CG12_big_fil_rev_8_21_14_0_65_30_8]|nr:MAG: cytochrome-c peroxidase [Ignavibacteriales bacterium CG12_big_fil_rev_8_21_14_0_65_30_8]